ncbi:MAG: haloacid dehalogenase-like hydrolase [Oscillospiraceae bacterium]|nr:haloacid dehalogenase-like hydrolase [Oscillospiraceae bacterium]
MNVYDFDKTIFYHDSSATFFRYCLKRFPGAVLRDLPGIVSALVRYARGRISTKRLKERLFAYLRFLPETEHVVEQFWDKHFTGIGEWYLAQKRSDDLIVTASPEFLVSEAGRRLGVAVIGTRMDIRSGRIEGENCRDREKVRRFREIFPEGEIKNFYSDSHSDDPMAELAARAFLVKKGSLLPWRAD